MPQSLSGFACPCRVDADGIPHPRPSPGRRRQARPYCKHTTSLQVGTKHRVPTYACPVAVPLVCVAVWTEGCLIRLSPEFRTWPVVAKPTFRIRRDELRRWDVEIGGAVQNAWLRALANKWPTFAHVAQDPLV